jgi:hypothetical protein
VYYLKLPQSAQVAFNTKQAPNEHIVGLNNFLDLYSRLHRSLPGPAPRGGGRARANFLNLYLFVFHQKVDKYQEILTKLNPIFLI